jgi:hypothetical protein
MIRSSSRNRALVIAAFLGAGACSSGPIKPAEVGPSTAPDAGTDALTVSQARAAWQATKGACPVYHYSMQRASFTGWTSTTTVEISHDQATRQDYLQTHLQPADGGLQTVIADQWSEGPGQIGSHGGGTVKTMEQLYDDCEREVLSRDRATNEVNFAPGPDGVLRSCWYRPKNCADDCTISYGVDDFGCGPLGGR